MESINIGEKLRLIAEHWSPRTVTTVNDYDVRLAKVSGEFVHHQPFAATEASILSFEPSGIVNTGDAGGELTAARAEI